MAKGGIKVSRSILVLASGGLDSSVVITLYKNLGYDVHTLYFNYGNINAPKEYSKLESLCNKLDIPSSNRYSLNIEIPWSKGGCVDGTNPNPYIEMRNLIFLSYAISLAEAKEIDEIAVGFIKVPVDYSDTSYDFLANINQLSLEATAIPIRAPLKELDKAGVYRLGRKLGINLRDTFSCNYSKSNPCGKCGDCQDILKLIEDEQIPDEENPFK